MRKCFSCNGTAAEPYRLYGEEGEVVEGCIDSFHDLYVDAMSEVDAAWHNRPEAVTIRGRDGGLWL